MYLLKQHKSASLFKFFKPFYEYVTYIQQNIHSTTKIIHDLSFSNNFTNMKLYLYNTTNVSTKRA